MLFEDSPPLEGGRIRQLCDGSDLTIAVCGVPTFMATDAAERLAQSGISVDLIEVSTLKPIDAGALTDSARKTGRVLTVEEHTICGGLAGAVAEVPGQFAPVTMDSIGVEDKFPESGDYMQLMGKYGISTDGIEARARNLVRGKAA